MCIVTYLKNKKNFFSFALLKQLTCALGVPYRGVFGKYHGENTKLVVNNVVFVKNVTFLDQSKLAFLHKVELFGKYLNDMSFLNRNP